MSNLQTHYHSKLDSPQVDQQIDGKCLIQDTNRRMDN